MGALHAVPAAACRCISPCPTVHDYDSEDLALRGYSSKRRAKAHIVTLERAKCVKVYDGDTITVVARPQGSAMGSAPREFSVRLSRIDAPELRSADSSEKVAARLARDFLARHVLDRCVTLSCCRKEKYGRVLAEVVCRGVNMSDALVAAGHAVPYDGGTKAPFGAGAAAAAATGCGGDGGDDAAPALPPAPPCTPTAPDRTPPHDAFAAGALVSVAKGKYAGRRGAVQRVTRQKVVIALEPHPALGAAAQVTLPPKSLRLALPSSHPSDDAARAAATTPWPPARLARAARGTPEENVSARAN